MKRFLGNYFAYWLLILSTVGVSCNEGGGNNFWKYSEGLHYGDVLNDSIEKGDTIHYKENIGIVEDVEIHKVYIKSERGAISIYQYK